MSRIPRPYEVYKHFKGNQYQIIAVAEHSETGETLVIYQALYGDYRIYARELSNFMSPVEHEKYPEVTQKQRFELQSGGNSRQEEETDMLQNVTSMDGQWSDVLQGNVIRDGQRSDVLQGATQDTSREDTSREDTPQGKATQDALRGSVPRDALQGSVPQDAPLGSITQDAPQGNILQGDAAQGNVPQDDAEINLDPMVIEFLDADSYEQRLNILAGLHHRITDEMITTMAISCDIEVEDGPTEQRYEELKTCLLTLEKYECNRVRI